MNWEENMYECEVWRDVMMVTMMMWQCDGDDDNDYGDDYINWDGYDCNYDQDIELVAAVDFPTFSAVSQGWAWNINDSDDFHDSLNVVIMMMSYNEISDDGDDLGNIEELLPCHWILNGPKCW